MPLLDILKGGLQKLTDSGALGAMGANLIAAAGPQTDPTARYKHFAKGLLAGGQQMEKYAQGLEEQKMRDAQLEHLQAQTRALMNPVAKPPQTRTRISGDESIVEQWDPASMSFKEISRGPRYKPTTNVNINSPFKPQSPIGKLYADRKFLVEKMKVPENSPQIQAIDRQIKTIGVPSGDKLRIQEMIASGDRTMQDITKTLMPDGKNVDMDAVTSMWASIPKTAGRTTSAQMEEAASFILRIETGAQANESEIRNTAKRYQPSPLDSPATARDKLMRLQRRFRHAKEIAAGQSVNDAAPARPKMPAKGIPAGVDPKDWNYLTDEERKLFQ